MSLRSWLRRLSLLPVVSGDVPLSPADPEPVATGGSEPAEAAPEEPELDLGLPEEPAPEPVRAQPDTSDLERRLADAERRLAERPAYQPPPLPPQQDPEYVREEEQLARARQTGSEDTVRWAQWEVNTNRTLRANTQAANRALAEAQDTRDQAAFSQLALTKPQLYKRYAPKVEALVTELRQKGQIVPARELLMDVMIGRDVRMGNAQPKKQPAQAPAATVPRGKMPPARTDVSGRGGQSEREKRRERLRNQFV